MLYLGDTLIHAEPGGVWSKNPQRLIADDPTRLGAFRLEEGLTGIELDQIEIYARTNIGALYSIPQAVLSARKSKKRSANDKQFCSRLVAQCYQNAGISIVEFPDFCTPNQISKSDLLAPIENCVRQATDGDIRFSKTVDYNLELQKETFTWLKKVRNLSEQHGLRPISNQNDVGHLVLENPHLDLTIYNYVTATKYPTLYDADRRKNPWRYESSSFLQKIISQPSPRDALARQKEINQSNIERHEKNLAAAIPQAASGLKYFEIDLILTKNILNEMYLWREAIIQAERYLSVESGSA